MSQTFELLKDPRITTSDADFAEQFDLLIQDPRQAVGDRHRCQHDPLAEASAHRLGRRVCAGDESAPAIVDDARQLMDNSTQIENRARAGRVHGRRRHVELPRAVVREAQRTCRRSSPAPTPVRRCSRTPCIDKLAGQADEQLAALQALRDGELAELNRRIAGLEVAIIGV